MSSSAASQVSNSEVCVQGKYLRCSNAKEIVGAMPDEQKQASPTIRMIKLQRCALYDPEVDLSG